MRRGVALVTGIGGFAGTHLAEHLLERGLAVVGIHGRRVPEPAITCRCRLFAADVRDGEALRRIVQQTRPDVLFHLAGRTSDAESFRDPEAVLAVNMLGTLHVLEAARGLKGSCRVVVVGSSAVYGGVPEEALPIGEEHPHRPLSPYGTSKAAADLLARQYFESCGLDVVRVIPFNHTGPRQGAEAALPAFARQIAELEIGSPDGEAPPTIHVGDLSARRDFLDVRDVVRAYFLLAECGEPGEVYNVCSGQGYAMEELLDRLLALGRGPDIVVRVDPARVRPASIPAQIGSNARLRAATGWQPCIAIEQTLADLLDFWRERVRACPGSVGSW